MKNGVGIRKLNPTLSYFINDLGNNHCFSQKETSNKGSPTFGLFFCFYFTSPFFEPALKLG
jgi:hypothetical protein